MGTAPIQKGLIFALLMTVSLTASGVAKLELSPTRYEFGDLEGGGTAQAAFDVRITGLDSDVVVGFYDFGLIYDPSIMTLASFGGFTGLLGDPDQFEVLNGGPSDPVNSTWDYRTDHPTLGAYTGPVLGTPVISGSGTPNEGSLRFSQLSLLGYSALRDLQQTTPTPTLALFSLIFDVDTSEQNHKRGTALRFVDDRDYANFGVGTGSLLDVKLGTSDAELENPAYLPLQNASVFVPLPASVWLMTLGLGVLGVFRLRRYSTSDA
jgi:hypothetical protein